MNSKGPSTKVKDAPNHGATIFPILLVNFIGTLGYSIILPFLIVLVLKFGGNELIYGILGATYSFFQFIGAPILGKWSDKFGRKKVLLLSQGGTFLAWLLFVLALRLPTTEIMNIDSSFLGLFVLTLPLLVLFMARALDGLTGGNVSVANAYLADVTTEDNRKKNFGQMAASGNLGFIIGPALAGVLGGTILGELLPVLAALIISLVAIFVISFLLKESRRCEITSSVESSKIKKVLGLEHRDCYEISGTDSIDFRGILKLPHIPLFLVLYFLVFLAFNFFYVAFPVHAIESLEWTLLELGIFFSVMGFILVIVQGPVLSTISKKYADSILLAVGSIFLGVGFFLFVSIDIIFIYLGVAFFSVGNGLLWPSFLALLSRIAGKKYQGVIQGYGSSVGSLASIIGLIGGGLIYGLIGVKIFWIPSLILVIIFALTFRLIAIEKKLVV